MLFRAFYILFLALLAGSAVCSNFMMNLAWTLLFVNWLAERDFKRKFADFRTNGLLHFAIFYFLLSAISLIWTRDLYAGLDVLRQTLPLLVVPLVVLTSRPLTRLQWRLVAIGYVGTLLVVTVIGFIRWLTIPDLPYRQIVPFISHIRFSLNLVFAIILLLFAVLKALYEKVIVTGWQWCGADVWFVWICEKLLKLLNFLYGLIPNYAVAIILLTIIVRAVTTPFTLKQMKATRGMAALKPQMDEINVKYRSDPQKKQAAMMELYAKNGINPLQSCTGCLPMLIQMPIFMGLFFVLGRAIELRGQHAFLWVTDLSRSDVVWSGISIPIIMPSGLAILPWIMVATMYFQTKVTMGSNAAMDPAQQKMMIWMMPAMMLLFSAVMPSGLVIYMIVSNIWGIVQYKLINRNLAPVGATSDKLKGKDVKDAEIVKKK